MSLATYTQLSIILVLVLVLGVAAAAAPAPAKAMLVCGRRPSFSFSRPGTAVKKARWSIVEDFAIDRCYRCTGVAFEIIAREELRRAVPDGVTLQALRWPL
jgi:hypothetical protein